MEVSRDSEEPTGADSRAGQIAKIARLYYIEDLGQRQIADRLRVSTASVSRALARAKELGIVRIAINESAPAAHSDLEVEVERRFGLRECVLVSRFERTEQTYRALAVEMGGLLARLSKTGSTLGLSWGETLKAIGERLPENRRLRVDVVPIVGAMGTIETGVYPNSIARSFAEKLGGKAYLVNTPGIVDSPEVRTSLMSDSNFEQVRKLWRRLSTIVLGVSGLDVDTSVYRGGIFTKSDLSRMRAIGGVCATNIVVLDAQGRPISTPFSDRIVSLTMPEMREVDNVVLVAVGDNKVAPLRAALRGGFAHVLVTDVECARALVAP